MTNLQVKLSLCIAGVTACAVLAYARLGVVAHAAQRFENTLEQQIVAKEKEGLDDLKAGNIDAFGRLTSREAVFVDDHGPASRADVLQHLQGFRLTAYSMQDIRFVPLSARSGLISYKIAESGTSRGHRFSAKAYVSSAWIQRGDQWQCVMSQETPAK